MNKIFNIYKYLTQEGLSIAEISDTANIKQATVYKYMDLFKKAGFRIVKINKVYKIVRYANLIKLSDAETGLIAYLELLSHMLFSKRKNKLLLQLIDKMLEFTNEKTCLEINNKFNLMKKASDVNLYREKLELFDKYKNAQRVIVSLKNGKNLFLRPIKTIFKNKKIFFNFMDDENKEIKEIEITKIINIAPYSNQLFANSEAKEVIFELYGRLSKIYVLKEGERIVNSAKDKLTIANNSSDKKALFKRLLRYDTLCKIRFPKKDALEFKKLIEKSLDNIDGIDDNMNREVTT